MSTVHYSAPDILQWLGTTGERAKVQGKQLAKSKGDQSGEITANLKAVASAAASFGKEALADIVRTKVAVYKVTLYDKGMEIQTLTGTKKVEYSWVTGIDELSNDRFEIKHSNGKAVIKPCGYLLVDRLKLPIGWLRNGLEVSYHTLIEEIAARSSIEIAKK